MDNKPLGEILIEAKAKIQENMKIKFIDLISKYELENPLLISILKNEVKYL